MIEVINLTLTFALINIHHPRPQSMETEVRRDSEIEKVPRSNLDLIGEVVSRILLGDDLIEGTPVERSLCP